MVGNKVDAEKAVDPKGDLFDLKQKYSVFSKHLISL